jgi:NADH dehydrogenase [ubiquinone] 1 alpha subcomplex assembly factor 3
VQKLTDEGFHLTDGLIVPGGVVFLDNRAFLWDVDPPGVDSATGRGKWEGWSKERFKIFETVVPRPG